MRQIIACLVLSFFAICGAQAQDYKLGDLTIGQPWTRATPPGARTGGGYMVIVNTGAAPDKLLSVKAVDISENVQLHQMGMTNGIMTMRPMPGGVDVPANGKVEFKPGAYHVMFLELKASLKQGDHVKATLQFEHAGSIDVDFEVVGIGQTTPPAAHAMPM